MRKNFDEIDIAQHILEGRCLDCDEIEPEHLSDCPNHHDVILMRHLENLRKLVNEWQASRRGKPDV